MAEPQGNFHVHPDAAPYDTSITDYLHNDPHIQNVCIGAVIGCGNQMLLIQRAEHDFAGLKWEVPGGACEHDKDKTILHSVEREVWEETGLHVRSIRRLVDFEEFQDIAGEKKGRYIWRKLTFQVEVEEGYGLDALEKRRVIEESIKMDPNEHCDWGWATKEDVEKCVWEKGKLDFMGLQQKTLLEGFAAMDMY
ncbi:NUDIX hydrolase domain-containing protein [Pochonia chlamydosporia 170]|uniref:NUDIX hydrolase domain-containing protein n=1 Tax=Pochonia chlamydosporia 170 TaxID=1380566 RepID=A0A179G2N4_METCM|nr:NUDIX hydrolase domain-containing protein [Pochonia chlamydosporia 170]OAQ72124.1 NUDIX hydrolase domain-containing protein [Pochonia chlamydosporia 170]